jgi:hypothetical protein
MGCFTMVVSSKFLHRRQVVPGETWWGCVQCWRSDKPRDSSSGCTIEGFLADTWKIKERELNAGQVLHSPSIVQASRRFKYKLSWDELRRTWNDVALPQPRPRPNLADAHLPLQSINLLVREISSPRSCTY